MLRRSLINSFKIHCLLPTHHENDILRECILDALRWADKIYVYDTAGDPETVRIIREISSENPNVMLFRSEFLPVSNWSVLALEMFKFYSGQGSVGDWWNYLFTDERYPEDPRVFLAKVPYADNCVFSSHLNYYFTEDDDKRFADDFDGSKHRASGTSLTQKLSYYKNSYSEPRFFRFNEATPSNMFFHYRYYPNNHPNRILVQHYQYRFPAQIIDRVRSRQATFSKHPNFDFCHEMDFRFDEKGFQITDLKVALKNMSLRLTDQDIYKSRIVDKSILDYDFGDLKFTINERHLTPVMLPFSSLLRSCIAQCHLRFLGLFRRAKNRFALLLLLHR